MGKEDWWAIWIGLGLTAVAIALFESGIKWLAVAPQKWSQFANAADQLKAHAVQYAALFVPWSALSLGAAALGIKLSRFLRRARRARRQSAATCTRQS